MARERTLRGLAIAGLGALIITGFPTPAIATTLESDSSGNPTIAAPPPVAVQL
jgi:hypothetical protein